MFKNDTSSSDSEASKGMGVILGLTVGMMLLLAVLLCCALTAVGWGAYHAAKASGAQGSTPMVAAAVAVCCCSLASAVGNALRPEMTIFSVLRGPVE